MKRRDLIDDLSEGNSSASETDDALVVRTFTNQPYSSARTIRALGIIAALVMPALFLRNGGADVYIDAVGATAFAVFVAACAAGVDGVKLGAYRQPPYLRSKRVTIHRSAGGERKTSTIDVEVDGKHMGAPLHIVTTSTAFMIQSRRSHRWVHHHHVAIVFSRLVVRVATFDDDEQERTASRFARALSNATRVGASPAIDETPVDDTLSGRWGMALAVVLDLVVFPAIAVLIAPHDLSTGVPRIFIAAAAWVPIHFAIHYVVLRWIRAELASIAAKEFGVDVTRRANAPKGKLSEGAGHANVAASRGKKSAGP